VLFVSHNMAAVTSLCPMVIWLDQGSVRKKSSARTVIGEYLSGRVIDRDRIVSLAKVSRFEAANDTRLRLESFEWLSDLPLRHGEKAKARIRFKTRTSVSSVSIAIGFSNFEGARLLTYETDFQDGFRPDLPDPGTYAVEIDVAALPLAPDTYNLDLGCRSGDNHSLDYLPGCSQVQVIGGNNTPGYIVRKGAAVRLTGEWNWDIQCRVSMREDVL